MFKKPVYINVFTYAFPVTAIISILHRISGVFVFLLIPFFLCLLQNGIYYPWLQTNLNKFILWVLLSAFIYHLCAGIRHMLMDAGFGENKQAATTSSYIVIVFSVMLSIVMGIRLC